MNYNNPADFVALGFGIIFIYFIVIIGMFVLMAFYYKTMVEVMSLVRPKNRQTSVGDVLFMFIPLFNIVYGFIVYPKICDSISKEYKTLKLSPDGDFGKGIAITIQVLSLVLIIPFLNFLAAIALLIIAIIFWSKIDGYKKKLEQYNKNGFAEGQEGGVSGSADILD